MKNIFVDPHTSMLRAGWRIAAFILIFLALNVSLTFIVGYILGSLKGGGTLWFTLLGFSATLAVYISRKYLEKSDMVSLGLKFNFAAIYDVVIGIAIGALIMAGMFYLLLSLDLIRFEGWSWWSVGENMSGQFSMAVLPVALAMVWRFCVVAWWEELVFRGLLIQNITKGLGVNWAILISTLIFSFIHSNNPNATPLSTLLIAFITFKLVYAYFKTGQLWLPMGLHLGWNFFQASVFGFASSGITSPSLINQSAIGPDHLSGGSFGAEGSIYILPFVLISIILIHFWVRITRESDQKFFAFAI